MVIAMPTMTIAGWPEEGSNLYRKRHTKTRAPQIQIKAGHCFGEFLSRSGLLQLNFDYKSERFEFEMLWVFFYYFFLQGARK